MTSIRILLAGVAAAGIAAAAPAQAQSCIRPAEKSAFDVRALQSQLMVAALNCGQEDQYNQFVTRYRTELGGAYNTINSSFRRAGGQRALDSYITTLANAQSQDGIRQGTRFCANAAPMFEAALASPNNSTSLAQLAVLNNLSNPHGRDECAAGATPAAAERPARASRPARAAARR